MSEKRTRTTHSRFTARWYGNCGRNQLHSGSFSLTSLYASITYDWHVSGAMTECFWFCPFSRDRQTKRRTETDTWDEQVYIKTHRQTRVRTETRQGGQDRNRDKRQKTTDENQETGRETTTVVRCRVHCDACCCDGGCVVVWWSCRVVLLCCSCCVRVSLLLGPFEGWPPPSPPLGWRFALSCLEVAAIPRYHSALLTPS